jgi:hypothetical protein
MTVKRKERREYAKISQSLLSDALPALASFAFNPSKSFCKVAHLLVSPGFIAYLCASQF